MKKEQQDEDSVLLQNHRIYAPLGLFNKPYAHPTSVLFNGKIVHSGVAHPSLIQIPYPFKRFFWKVGFTLLLIKKDIHRPFN